MNRTMRTYYTTMGIFLILLVAWVGSYLALRTWKNGGDILTHPGKTRWIITAGEYQPLTIVYQPLVFLDSKLTDTSIIFGPRFGGYSF